MKAESRDFSFTLTLGFFSFFLFLSHLPIEQREERGSCFSRKSEGLQRAVQRVDKKKINSRGTHVICHVSCLSAWMHLQERGKVKPKRSESTLGTLITRCSFGGIETGWIVSTRIWAKQNCIKSLTSAFCRPSKREPPPFLPVWPLRTSEEEDYDFAIAMTTKS